jgi:hypothetical protein
MSFGLNNDIFTKKFTSQGTYQTDTDVRAIINQYFPLVSIENSTNITALSVVPSDNLTFKIILNEDLIGIKSISNKTGSCYLNIIGGLNVSKNIITGDSTNIISEGILYSGIIGGSNNGICGNSKYSGIVGGYNNNIKEISEECFIGGGANNGISGGSYFSGIIGGANNGISGGSYFSGLIGGQYNLISGGSSFSGLIGGYTNYIKESSVSSFIGGGQNNTISGGSSVSSIIGGKNNIISGSSKYSGIVGGQNNNIKEISEECFIGGGQDNTVSGGSFCSAIIAGSINKISTTGNNCGIFGGNKNIILDNGDASCILGGESNSISGNNYTRSVIAGGTSNKIGCSECFIGGGEGLSLPNGVSYRYSAAFGRYNNINIINSITSGVCVQTPYNTHIGSSVRLIVGSGIQGACANAMVVDSKGNLFLGDETHNGACIFHWNSLGSCYHAKAFTIPHPEKEEKWLIHGCLEGPESGVYYRGKGVAPVTVYLPSYASKIARDFTVNVTPIGNPRTLGVTEVTYEGTFDVKGEGKFFWHAIGERIKLETEPDRDKVNIKRIGPYSWIE